MLLQIQGHVQELLTAAARPRFKWDCPANSLPPHWAPQQSNTELFEVDLASPEIGSLMEAMCDLHHLTIVKVRSSCCILGIYTLVSFLCTDGILTCSVVALDCFGVCYSIPHGIHVCIPVVYAVGVHQDILRACLVCV